VNRNKRSSRRQEIARSKGVHNRAITIAIYLFLVGITLVVFGQTIRYEFVNFDDDLYVYDAPAIKAGLTKQGIALAFTKTHARNWHPLTTISHMLDCQLYGLDAGGHHATNVFLQIIAVLLLFGVLRQMTGAMWKSAIVAGLFAIHPLHVESVAWVSERKDLLSAVFFFLMVGAYVRYARGPSIVRYVMVVVLFTAGLLSKPMLVSAPVILLLLDYWPLHRLRSKTPEANVRETKEWKTRTQSLGVSRLIVEKIPLFVLSAGSCAITFAVQKRASGAIPPLPFVWRVENAVVSYVIYIWKTLWPARLAAFYPHPDDTLSTSGVILALAFLLAITMAAIVCRRQRGYLVVGWFWYVVMLLPVIGVIQVGEQGHADRYTYLPQVGLFLLAVWGVGEMAEHKRSMSRIALAVVGSIIVALAWTAFIQTSYWRNSETLWTHALAVTHDNDFAHNNLGYLCASRGKLDEAISHFEAAARIRSQRKNKHYNVGSAFVEMNLGDALAQKGESDDALLHYDQAIRLEPNYADAYYNRGNVLFAKDRLAEAIADWEKTLLIQPNDADAHTCIGNALLRQGSSKEAIAQYEIAAALAPEDPHSRINIAWTLATSPDDSIRDGAKALSFAQQAVALSGGGEPQFLRTLGAAYAETGQFTEAIVAARQAAVIANMQGKQQLAKSLENDLMRYDAHRPLHATSMGD
jgi:tetratricopeptide (TPR) repeat protein